MNRWRVRRIYRYAAREYERGILEGLAGNEPIGRNTPGRIASYHGRAIGKGFNPGQYGGGPDLTMPAYVWAEVLAEAMRP